MFKKVILTFVLLISAQQEFYGSDDKSKEEEEAKMSAKEISNEYNFWYNIKYKIEGCQWLWVFTDNIPFQYGNSKVWEHVEAYYGLSNGIGFFLSFLNFGWLKIGFGDFHINVINAITKYIRIYVAIKYDYYCKLEYSKMNEHKLPVWLNSLKWWLFYTIVPDTQLFSLKFFNCIKLKIISIGAIISYYVKKCLVDQNETAWYFKFYFFTHNQLISVPGLFFVLSPRIEINISEIINYFKKK